MEILDVPGRDEPDVQAPEKDMLLGWLDYHRETVLAKVSGVDEESVRRAGVGSGTSLLGIVKHLALAEHYWFPFNFAGICLIDPQPDARSCPCGLPWPNEPESWTVARDESTEHIVATYREACARSRAITAEASLDELARGPENKRDYTLRWIVTHMIEETARHNGHLDILREQIDGAIGV
jgi:hypothetical protein